jgi:hypothetical protein
VTALSSIHAELRQKIELMYQQLSEPKFMSDAYRHGYVKGLKVALGIVVHFDPDRACRCPLCSKE